MTLQELSREYQESARLLRDRLAYLRRQIKQTDDPAEVWRLNRRIAVLECLWPMGRNRLPGDRQERSMVMPMIV